MTADQLAGPGTFWILFGSGLGFAIFYVLLALRLGKVGRRQSDGCLLAVCNLVLVVTGGSIGFLLFRFPAQLISAMAGSFLLPGIVTAIWVSRMTRR